MFLEPQHSNSIDDLLEELHGKPSNEPVADPDGSSDSSSGSECQEEDQCADSSELEGRDSAQCQYAGTPEHRSVPPRAGRGG